MHSSTKDQHRDAVVRAPLDLPASHDRPAPTDEPADDEIDLPLAVVFPGSECVLVLGRSRVCLLDSIPFETAGNRAVFSLPHATAILHKAGWTQLGDWRLIPPPSPEVRRLGIPPHATAAPVTRMLFPH
ncbi:MAG: hypothetical protein LLG14_22280 [Nocardiaceae bacterium]|nr:hypothetical protein [Nocardiaceae bacterium]